MAIGASAGVAGAGGVGIPPLLIERLPKLDKTGGGGMPANNAGSGTAMFSGVNGILVPNKGVASLDAAVKIRDVLLKMFLNHLGIYESTSTPSTYLRVMVNNFLFR